MSNRVSNGIILKEIRELREENKELRESVKIESKFTHYWSPVTFIYSVALSLLAISFSLGGIKDESSAYIYYYLFYVFMLGGIPIFTILRYVKHRKKS